jgi:outer membrane protein assembly factor BamD (BamD/ComL family)
LKRKESLFIQGIKKVKDGKLMDAEKDLKKVVKKKSPESEKAQILLTTIEVRKECQKLLKEIE